MASPLQILLTGATGYIGGTVLDQLLQSDHPALKDATVSCLVRGEARIATLKAKYGKRVNPLLYKDLDDVERTVEVASQHDIAINTTTGLHAASSLALVKGLAQRKKSTGKDVYMILTTGTSNLADQPVTKAYVEEDPNREFDDATDDIYSYEKKREEQTQYPQRTAELSVIDAGLESAVKTLVIMSGTIYGKGSGLFNTSSMQIPMLLRQSISDGQAMVVEDGTGIWDHVHVADLAGIYVLAIQNMLEKSGADLPFGKQGIIFSGNGRHSWRDLSQSVADAAFAAGKLPTRDVRSVPLQDAANALTFGYTIFTELGFASNSRTKSTVARERLGWKPSRGAEAWEQGFKDDVEALAK